MALPTAGYLKVSIYLLMILFGVRALNVTNLMMLPKHLIGYTALFSAMCQRAHSCINTATSDSAHNNTLQVCTGDVAKFQPL